MDKVQDPVILKLQAAWTKFHCLSEVFQINEEKKKSSIIKTAAEH
jgi:hypothetical protein